MAQPLRILCGREIQNTIKDSVKQLLDDLIKLYEFDDFFKSTQSEIKGVNGSIFIFSGLQHNPAKIKSMEGVDIAWLEEADSISQDTLDLLIPTIRKENSEIWFSYNPRDINAPVHQMFVVNDHPGAFVRKINYDENPWFPEVLRRSMEYDKAHDPGKYQHIWLGEPVKHSEALVFYGKWRIDDTFEIPEDTIFYYGADWGFSTDPAVLIRMFCNHKKRILYVTHEAYGVGIEIDDLPAFFDTVPDSRKWIITADSQRPDTISYMKRQDFKIRGAIKGKGSVVEGTEFLRSYTIVVHSRCKNVIYELGSHSYKVDKLTKDVLPLLEDKNNHCIDSMRYALEKITRKREVVDLLKRN
jgi:phage terminase large subunit